MNYFLIGNPSELETVIPLSQCSELKLKLEAKVRSNPSLLHLQQLSCVYYMLGEAEKCKRISDALLKAVKENEVPADFKSSILVNVGLFYRGYGELQKGDSLVEEAYRLHSNPHVGMAHAESLLRVGKWEDGWKLHNAVRGTRMGAAESIGLKEANYWDGTDTPELLLVLNEGGSGDRINYSRFLSVLTERGINWKFYPSEIGGPALRPLYERLPWIKDRIVQEGEEITGTHWTTLFSLPEALGTTPETLPAFPTPFVAPERDSKLTSNNGRPLIGICYSAAEEHQGGLKIRSLSEGQAMRLVAKTEDTVNWINVQWGKKLPHPVLNFDFHSWDDTATLIDRLDGIVTVDCGTYHLAGALNKPTLTLLSSHCDWKFGTEEERGSKDIWYPSSTLVRNGPSDKLQDMDKAIDKAIELINSGEWLKQFDSALDSIT